MKINIIDCTRFYIIIIDMGSSIIDNDLSKISENKEYKELNYFLFH